MKICILSGSDQRFLREPRAPLASLLQYANRRLAVSVLGISLLALPGSANADYLSTVKSDGAVAYYAFNEAAGSTSFTDSITGGGTHLSALVTSGDSAYVTAGTAGLPGLGTSVTFSGSASNLNVLSIAAGGVIDSSSVLSYDFWVKQTSTFTRNEMLFNNGNWADEMFTKSNGTYNNQVFANQEGGYTTLSPSVLSLNTWHNIAVTKTAGGTATFYVDGTQISTGNHTQNFFQTQLFIGASNGSGFNGSIAGLGFFDTTLTGSEINSLITVANEGPTSAVPEPSSLAMAGIGLLSLVGRFARRKRAA